MDGDLRVFTIVGIVGDVRAAGLDAQPFPTFYAEYRQRPLSTFSFTFVLQTAVPAASIVPQARAVFAAVTPELPPRFRMIEQVVDSASADPPL